MEISRNVILDLLPLYVADEVSDDTRVLVEKYLKSHPDLAEAARNTAALAASAEIPSPLKKEDQMEAYSKTKQKIILWVIGLAFVFAAMFGVALMAVILLFFRNPF